ncbi:MAG: UDP-N-acetylmuramoyl-tripeptide--D-alanyl-D-alanine ligase [Deltaproteobacteria bacterium]|nr:MAG: UDP-N-acetylmuramoyl-tripeptide--D-alanyl-D-alanine ligase [Deltaproteobacteria bacterium]
MKSTGGKLTRGELSTGFQDISTDSRTVRSGELFIALKGEHYDGHDFLPQAVKRGATGLLIQNASPLLRTLPPPEADRKEPVVIEVNDTLYALGQISHYWRKMHPISLAAITGSNGKTTTKEMLAGILEHSYNVLKTEGNLNNLVGVPLTLLRLSAEHEIAVLELGTNQPGEITRLTEITEPQVGVITNVSDSHLEFLKTKEGVARAKGELFHTLRTGSTAVFNADDPSVAALADSYPGNKLSFGIKSPADVRAGDIFSRGTKGTKFKLITRDGRISLNLAVPGITNVYNALAASAVALIFNTELRTVKKALEKFTSFPGRMEIIHLDKGIYLLNDTYNANPESMKESLNTLSNLGKDGRTIAVLADMLELGETAEASHRQLGRTVADLDIDLLFVTGQWAEAVISGAKEKGMNNKSVSIGIDHKEIVRQLKETVRNGDWILVKGSRKMRMERIVDSLSGKRGS